MAIVKLEVREVGDNVIVITTHGIEKAEIASRKLENNNEIKYGLKVSSQRNQVHRFNYQIFNTADELLDYYKKQFEKPIKE